MKGFKQIYSFQKHKEDSSRQIRVYDNANCTIISDPEKGQMKKVDPPLRFHYWWINYLRVQYWLKLRRRTGVISFFARQEFFSPKSSGGRKSKKKGSGIALGSFESSRYGSQQSRPSGISLFTYMDQSLSYTGHPQSSKLKKGTHISGSSCQK